MTRILFAIAALVAFASQACAQQLTVENSSPDYITLFVRASNAPAGRDWTSNTIPPGQSVTVNLVSRDMFDVRIHHHADDDHRIEWGVDDVDLRQLASQPGLSSYNVLLKEWRVLRRVGNRWIAETKTADGRAEFDAEMIAGNGSAIIDFPQLVGHKNPRPIIRP